MNPENNLLKNLWKSLDAKLGKGIASSSMIAKNKFSMLLRIVGTLNGLEELTLIINHIYE